MSLEAERILLDPQQVARLAGALPVLRGRTVERARAVTFWVKPRRHFNACYELDVGEAEPLVISGFALAPGRADAIAARLGSHSCADGAANACPPCATVRGPGGLLLRLFPFDHRLRWLRPCLDARSVRRALALKTSVVGCEPQGYRPGMRCQIRYRLADGTSLFGKIAYEREPGRAFRQQVRLHRALAGGGRRVAVARPSRYVPELRLTVVHEVRGRPLHRILWHGAAPGDAPCEVAAGLAEFHTVDVDGIERLHGPEHELALVHAWAELVAELFPELAPMLRRREEKLRQARPADAQGRAVIHRDFYDNQVLLASGRCILLDLDTVCRGDPEIDLGNFCAHLRLRALQIGRVGEARSLEERFLGAYPGPQSDRLVDWYRKATLLRLACVYALRPNWRWIPPLLLGAGRNERAVERSDGIGHGSGRT